MLQDDMIKVYEDLGFKRWTKGNYDRLYISAEQLGLDCDYYKTGNISGAEFQGKHISNSEAYRMKAAKTYIDIKTGKLRSDNWTLEQAARVLTDIPEEKK